MGLCWCVDGGGCRGGVGRGGVDVGCGGEMQRKGRKVPKPGVRSCVPSDV